MNTKPLTHTLGYPRIGGHRELKRATEAYWNGQITAEELEAVGRCIRRENWLVQQRAGIDLIPSNDFSFYDQVLDLTCLVGNVPARFGWRGGNVDLDTRFAIARGVRTVATEAATPSNARRASGAVQANVAVQSLKSATTEEHASACGCPERTHWRDVIRTGDCLTSGSALASELTKWFDTNYHYIVPELSPDTQFALSATKIFDEFSEALALGIKTKPVLIGPVTYLMLGKVTGAPAIGYDPLRLLNRLLPVYVQVLERLAALGAEWVQLDEPVYALDLSSTQRHALALAYATLCDTVPQLKLIVATYFGPLRSNRRDFLRLPVAALHIDLVRAPEEFDAIARELPASTLLSLGLVDGRNVWRTDLSRSLPLIEKAVAVIGVERLLFAPSCSLQHVPLRLRGETKLDPDIRGWLAFAEEKLIEVVGLRDIAAGAPVNAALAASHAAAESRRTSARIHRAEIQARVANIAPSAFQRRSAFAERQPRQRARLGLLLLPTTTIGSFPQTPEVRAVRAQWRRGELDDVAYEAFLEREVAKCISVQEQIGLDVLVHGEFERTDMVEYFGEQLEGFAITSEGWVQSYGSRYVKPPIIYGDVARPRTMTVRWTTHAQSLTAKPVKGMLTGPLTLLEWSFVRDDQPRRSTALQLALALRDEVLDLEAAGIAAIQIDEPALREGLPLRRGDWPAYLAWAVDAFRLASSGVRDDTQIHTHMCYAEFNDIIGAIAALDADVISIEASRSNMELLRVFSDFKYPNEIGPGVYDIHSPRVPSIDEITRLVEQAGTVIPVENLWVNPDCGLKTRTWPEVNAALRNMVQCADRLREHFALAGVP